MTHTATSRVDSADAVVAAYIHEISARHAPAPSRQGQERRGERPHGRRRSVGARAARGRGHSLVSS